MDINPVLSHGLAALVGVLIGALGTYFADKYTDRRREKESGRSQKQKFAKIKDAMPELIAELQADVRKPDFASVRDFFVTRTGTTMINNPGLFFRYSEVDHENLFGKIAILENNGYVFDVTAGNTPKYRMTEEFVELLRG